MNKEDAWAWQRECADKAGRHLVEFEVMEGPEKGNKLYKGKIQLNVKRQVPGPGGIPQVQQQQVPFEFDFPAGKGLNYCKKHFDEEANKAVKEWEAEQKKAAEAKRKQIVPASANQVPKMLGPNGKPIG